MNIPCKTYIKYDMKVYDLIEENHTLLLMLQHFEIDFRVDDLTVRQLCEQYNISERLFIAVANLYNGFKPKENPLGNITDVMMIIGFLRNSHKYYREDKYPQISNYIHLLQERHPGKELVLLEQFFNVYFDEVMEHLDYEDNVAFPYFVKLINEGQTGKKELYSAKEYSDHHTDIELKLKDLKNLLLKHITTSFDLTIKRKLLFSLFELEHDLYIHSLIEETILIPYGYKMERL
ncbi:MAG: hypothetical protein GXZ03_01850 [Proteiniphilum sp.]|nr:hypothetical protein [Proteiniphilum sp.]